MKQQEKEKIITAVTEKINQDGIPVNIRLGSHDQVAEWFERLLSELVAVDVPQGVRPGADGYNYCPMCNHTVGDKAHYCKYCGSYLRMED